MKHTLFQLLFKFLCVFLVFSEQIQATTIQSLYEFPVSLGSLPGNYVENDWNPADGDTYWTDIGSGSLNTTELYYLDFAGDHANASFISSNDLWETVSIKSMGIVPGLAGTQEIQLAIYPKYAEDPGNLFPRYISILLRLTMGDGSIWDQTKSFVNNRWQKGVFSTKPNKFINPEWSTPGEFNLSNVVSWEIILVDLPEGEHSVKLRSLLIKGDYEVVDPNIPDEFNTVFPKDESGILFLKNDSNPSDGDTQWLSHNNKLSHYYSTNFYTTAAYRYEGDIGETLSIKKESQSYFDLSNATGIIARLNNLNFTTKNSLIMQLTMEDGSIWQKGIPLSQNPVRDSFTSYVDYIFPIDNQGNGWEMVSSELENNLFDPSRIKAWELVFHNLNAEELAHPKSITLYHIIAPDAENSLLNDAILSVDDWNPKDGDMAWISSSYSGNGLTAEFISGGDPWDSVSIHSGNSFNPYQLNYRIDIQSSYANQLRDALTIQLTMADGSLWQKSFSLPVAGRYVYDIMPCRNYRPGSACPPSHSWKLVPWGATPINQNFSISNIAEWTVFLNTPPAGKHEIFLRFY